MGKLTIGSVTLDNNVILAPMASALQESGSRTGLYGDG